MTKQQLEFFLSAAEFSNLSRAAAFHYVSIPTFTRHINDLEEELNTKLFVRTNRGISITEAGALFHPVARITLDLMYEYNSIIMKKDLMTEKVPERFMIGYYPFGGMFSHFTDLIEKYLKVLMKMPCSLRCVDAGKMTEMVLDGVLDIGAVSMSRLEKYNDSFESRLFFSSRCILMVRPDHELAGRDSITVKELKELYGDFSHYVPAEKYSTEFKGKTIKDRRDILELCKHYLDLLPVLVADSQGNGSDGPEMIIGTSDLKRPELKGRHVVEIENGSLTMEVRLFWRKDNKSEAIRRFKDALDFAGIK